MRMSDQSIRWRQRYQNFQKALEVFERRLKAFRICPEEEAEQMALVQAFEIIVELSWKLIKDYLEYQGFKELGSPKQSIRQAWQSGLLSSAEPWMAALQKRNLTSHTYNEATLQNVVRFIEQEFSVMVAELDSQMQSNL